MTEAHSPTQQSMDEIDRLSQHAPWMAAHLAWDVAGPPDADLNRSLTAHLAVATMPDGEARAVLGAVLDLLERFSQEDAARLTSFLQREVNALDAES